MAGEEKSSSGTGSGSLGETLGLDVVGDPALYERFHQRILRGYTMDAMEGMDSA